MDVVVTTTTKMIAQVSVLKVHIPAMVPVPVNHGEKSEKFNGLNFKRWQQKIFYLTTMNLARFLSEEAPKLNEGETDMQVINAVDAWKHSDFLCKNYVMNGLHDFCIMFIVHLRWHKSYGNL